MLALYLTQFKGYFKVNFGRFVIVVKKSYMKPYNLKSFVPHLIAVGIFLIVAAFYCKPILQGKVLQQSDVVQWKGMAQDALKSK